MLDLVLKSIKRYNMLKDVTEITVALSGGADSVALLLCLLELNDKLNVNIYAAHLNHCLRGSESDRDEQYVRYLCQRLGITLFCECVDVRSEAEKTHESIELCARRIRYAFLERVSKGVIATAHTANDNIETVIHNMVRGTGIAGVCGIPPKRDRIIRPLINITRSQVEKFCVERNVDYCVDSTNSDETYTRNRIRHSIVPILSEINQGATNNVSQMSASLREDADLLLKLAKESLVEISCESGLKVDALLKLHPALRSRCIALSYENSVGKTPESKHISAIIEVLSVGGKISVQNDWSAVVKNGVLKFLPIKNNAKIDKIQVLNFPFQYNGLKISDFTAENIKNTDKFNNLLLNNLLDCGKICGELILRSRINGDSIKLRKRPTKSLKKLFNENRIEEFLRDSWPILADEQGIVWVKDFGVAERCAVSEDTEKALIIEV